MSDDSELELDDDKLADAWSNNNERIKNIRDLRRSLEEEQGEVTREQIKSMLDIIEEMEKSLLDEKEAMEELLDIIRSYKEE